MKAPVFAACAVIVFGVQAAPVAAQILYMDPYTGSLYNGFGLPVSGPNPGRALDYRTTPSWQRNYIRPDGSTMNGFGVPTSGPNPMMQICLQNPMLC